MRGLDDEFHFHAETYSRVMCLLLALQTFSVDSMPTQLRPLLQVLQSELIWKILATVLVLAGYTIFVLKSRWWAAAPQAGVRKTAKSVRMQSALHFPAIRNISSNPPK